MEQQIYIHVGYAKAASTTLQKHLFDKHSQINNLGIYPTTNLGKDSQEINQDCAYLKHEELRKLYRNLVKLNSIEYYYSNNTQLYQQSVEPLLKSELTNVFSNEGFTSVLFNHNDLKSKAERLKSLFPQAKIIFVIRNQAKIIVSRYRSWPFDPRCVIIGKPTSFNRWIQIALEDTYTKLLHNLKYYEVINIYSEMFGRDNVGVFLFEDFVKRPNLFAEQLAGFMQIDPEETKSVIKNKHENLSVTQRYNLYRILLRKKIIPNLYSKKLERIMPSLLIKQLDSFLKGGKKKEYAIDSANQNRIEEYFGSSNSKLQQQYGLDLSQYDYPLAVD